jgi:hypothetical protein
MRTRSSFESRAACRQNWNEISKECDASYNDEAIRLKRNSRKHSGEALGMSRAPSLSQPRRR